MSNKNVLINKEGKHDREEYMQEQERANQQRREARQREYMQEQERANQQRRKARQREYMQEQEWRRVNDEDSRTATNVQSNGNNMPQSNDKIVSLVVSGTGSTKEEATKNALRSAIEQTFGTFVSANTEILNDNLIKDEIITITTGNIRKYEELYCTSVGGIYNVSLQATVSIGSLITYAQNKGMTAELAGASFAMNMKLRKLNKENELKAMDDLKRQLCIIANSGLFDYQIVVGEPHMATERELQRYVDGKWTQDKSRNIAVDVTIKLLANSKTIEFRETFLKALLAITLSRQEVEEYNSARVPYYYYYAFTTPKGSHFILRNKYDQKTIMDIISFARCFFSIKDNLGNTINPYIRAYEGEFTKYEFKGDFFDVDMRSDISTIYYIDGKRDVIRKNTMPGVFGYKSYICGDNLYIENYKTAYKNDDYNCFIEIGLFSSMIFSQNNNYGDPWSKYKKFMTYGSSIGEDLDDNKKMSGMKITLFYTEAEIEQLKSIQVDPVLPNINLERLVRMY